MSLEQSKFLSTVEEPVIIDAPEENSYSRLKRLGNMDNEQVRKSVYDVKSAEKPKQKSFLPIICVIIFSIVYLCPIMTKTPTAHSCLAILITAAFCWGTELVPSYATAYLIPAACVWLRVGYDAESGTRIKASVLATRLANKFMDPIIFVFLGSLTISAALTKLEITDRVSQFLLSHISPKPRVVLLALMILNFCIAAFLSNVASTTLVLTFSLPIIRSLDPDDKFINAILFGLAWSGNAGGMPTTISSPQNILAIKYINDKSATPISFIQWMGFAAPTSFILLIVDWIYLIILYKPKSDKLDTSSGQIEFKPWSFNHTMAVITTIVTIVMWALNETFSYALGHVGITSLIPVMVFFSIGILDSHDFGSLRWSTLVLMGGGLALGEAMTVSGLLDIIADTISNGLSGISIWVVLIIIMLIEAILTSVINHTSAAAILFPVLQVIGDSLHHPTVLLTMSAMMISCAQLFHISSFPNALISGVQRHMRMDPSKLTSESFLNGKDFFLVGWPTVIAGILILASVGYGIVLAMKFE
ncbi:Sodium:sulfate symporter transmembrane region family protein [Tritrichomonas foetus]|uniref:Sodium:sulfate symporter transmembrane region family protein n=1 Tax=Tritrichomonas foetus TaxID=1144522 RepID=A0A1J4JMI1_9EUKA|nr:Sodium:sulfate symporter transmembrane region family protein [Tritrichomonas foetus]|eukprot:OHS99905.1 Sodium:sulfate symporter transmembrane region family protein [Tritrichomonas foetus]